MRAWPPLFILVLFVSSAYPLVAQKATEPVSQEREERQFQEMTWVDSDGQLLEMIEEYTSTDTEMITRQIWQGKKSRFVVRQATDLESGTFTAQLFDAASYWWIELTLDSGLDLGKMADFGLGQAVEQARRAEGYHRLSLETSDGFYSVEEIPRDPSKIKPDSEGLVQTDRLARSLSQDTSIAAIPPSVKQALALINSAWDARLSLYHGDSPTGTLLASLTAALEANRSNGPDVRLSLRGDPSFASQEAFDKARRALGDIPDDLRNAR